MYVQEEISFKYSLLLLKEKKKGGLAIKKVVVFENC